MTTVIIHPEPPENMKPLIVELLGLADKASDVEYVMWPEPGLRVPEDVYARFLKTRTVKPEESPEPEVQEPKPVKRAPGRPKKEAQ